MCIQLCDFCDVRHLTNKVSLFYLVCDFVVHLVVLVSGQNKVSLSLFISSYNFLFGRFGCLFERLFYVVELIVRFVCVVVGVLMRSKSLSSYL